MGLEPSKIGVFCSYFHQYCSDRKMKDYCSPPAQLKKTNNRFLNTYAGFVSGRHRSLVLLHLSKGLHHRFKSQIVIDCHCLNVYLSDCVC